MKKSMFIASFVLMVQLLNAQVTTNGNTSFMSSDFVGWDSSTLFDLNIKHEGNFPIVFSTDNLERMRLNEDGRLLINLTVPTTNAALEVVGKSVGVRARANSIIGNQNYGGWFTASSSTFSYGVRGEAVDNTSGTNYGVAGNACNAQVVNYGVWGRTCNNNDFAGYFDGPTFSPGGVWTSSDENLKLDIQDLSNATEILMNLEPKTYYFDQSIDYVNLPVGMQYGLLAQDLEAVLPNIVREVRTPTQLDAEGNVTVESTTMKAVNYTQLIPLLIAGFKEQTQAESNGLAQIEELHSRLAALENSLAQVATNRLQETNESVAGVRLNQNFPNPFHENTTISMDVLERGNVRVDILNEKGEVIETLRNQLEEKGIIELIWDSTRYESGVYFYKVQHNGKVVINKMMKL
jgi:hypothetical protein